MKKILITLIICTLGTLHARSTYIIKNNSKRPTRVKFGFERCKTRRIRLHPGQKKEIETSCCIRAIDVRGTGPSNRRAKNEKRFNQCNKKSLITITDTANKKSLCIDIR